MNIFAGKGDTVRFAHDNAGYPKDRELAEKHLVLGQAYTVEKTIVHRAHTTVILEEFPNLRFNSVQFDDVNVNEAAAKERNSKYYLYGESDYV